MYPVHTHHTQKRTHSTVRTGLRKAGSVGHPLPGVTTKLTQENSSLLIKSPSIFKEYYNKPHKTREEFTDYGWIKTGDVASIDENGYFTIEKDSFWCPFRACMAVGIGGRSTRDNLAGEVELVRG